MNLFAKPMDLLVIAVIAFIVFGPEKFPEMAAKAGQLLREIKGMAGDMTAEFQEPLQEMHATMDEMRAAMSGIQEETLALTQFVPTGDDLAGLVAGRSLAGATEAVSTVTLPVVHHGALTLPVAPIPTNSHVLRPPSKTEPLADFAHLGG